MGEMQIQRPWHLKLKTISFSNGEFSGTPALSNIAGFAKENLHFLSWKACQTQYKELQSKQLLCSLPWQARVTCLLPSLRHTAVLISPAHQQTLSTQPKPNTSHISWVKLLRSVSHICVFNYKLGKNNSDHISILAAEA